MRKFLRATGLAMAAGAGLGACYPERPNQPSEYASITTVYDTLFAFGEAVTFYVPDSVVHVGGDDDISHVYDSLIVARIAANMVAAGYTRIIDTLLADLADLTLNPSVTVTDNYDYTAEDWCGIWEQGWAYPFTCSGWIPDHPSDVVGYTYDTGTILIRMADFTGGVPPAVSRPPVVWVAGINGSISGSSSAALAQSIADGIDQAFDQSFYIRRVVTP